MAAGNLRLYITHGLAFREHGHLCASIYTPSGVHWLLSAPCACPVVAVRPVYLVQSGHSSTGDCLPTNAAGGKIAANSEFWSLEHCVECQFVAVGW